MTRTRRGEERVCVALPVTLCTATGITRNVSTSGIFVETDVTHPVGAPVSFTMALDNPGGSLVLKGQGDVVRVEQCEARVGIAVRITFLTLESGP